MASHLIDVPSTARSHRIIAESVRDAEGGIESLPEREFELIRRRVRLPSPNRQQVLRRSDGRYYLDNDWPAFGVRVEIHGIPHMEVRNWDSDLLRQNDLSITSDRCSVVVVTVATRGVRTSAQAVPRHATADA
jgi:hypothetical protein